MRIYKPIRTTKTMALVRTKAGSHYEAVPSLTASKTERDHFRKQVDQSQRRIRLVITTERVDRDGDIIEAGGVDLEEFRQNPVVLAAHRGQTENPVIANATELIVRDTSIEAEIEFVPDEANEFAGKLFLQYALGFMRGASIGFVPKQPFNETIELMEDERGNTTGRRFKAVELLEFSLVAIPANPDALAVPKAVKAYEAWVMQPTPVAAMAKGTALSRLIHGAIHDQGLSHETVTKGLVETIGLDEASAHAFLEGKRGCLVSYDHAHHLAALLHLSDREIRRAFEADGCPVPDDDSTKAVGQTCGCQKGELTSETKNAISFGMHGDLPMQEADARWNGDREVSRWRRAVGGPNVEDMDFRRYAQLFAWRDADAISERRLTGFKLPHHAVIDGELHHHLRGAQAAMAALLGARGGVDIPENERRPVFNHLARELRRFDREPPDFRDVEPIFQKVDRLRQGPHEEAVHRQLRADVLAFLKRYDLLVEDDLLDEFEDLTEDASIRGRSLMTCLEETRQALEAVLAETRAEPSTKRSAREDDDIPDQAIQALLDECREVLGESHTREG